MDYRSKFDYEQLVQEDWVDGRIFTDPDIFEEEMEKIFHRWWIFVGHTSQIPEPGDYFTTRMGRQPVIMVRDEDGKVRLFLNRCTHRGNTVCQYERGNAQFFRCWYHGWTFNNKGQLIGVPHPSGYGEEFNKEELGLAEVPRIGIYRGFVFASLNPDGISFDEYLGNAKKAIDIFVEQSPVGEIELRAGVHKGRYRGNWKLVGMDGYHVEFVHISIKDLQSRADSSGDAVQFLRNQTVSEFTRTNRSRDLGNGHVRLDYISRELEPEKVIESLISEDWGKVYVKAMEKAYGKEKAYRLISLKTPHVGIWPNLQLIDSHVRVIYPISVEETVVYMYPALLKGVPEEVNEDRLRKHEWFYGPAGFGSPDDYEIFERNHVALHATIKPKVVVSRGMNREQKDVDGTIYAHMTDEVTQRGQYRQWKKVMSE